MEYYPPRRLSHSRPSTHTQQDMIVGTARSLGWRAFFGQPPRPYEIDLRTNQGILLGMSEAALSRSMHRLAFNAASAGWKVFLFDPQGSQEEAATFYATMQQAGRSHIHVFPAEPYDGWQGTGEAMLHRLLQVSSFREPYYQHIAITELATALLRNTSPIHGLETLVQRLLHQRGSVLHDPLFDTVRYTDMSGPPLQYQTLSELIGKSLNGNWSFDHADAAYCSFSAWNRPEEARLQARFLLADLASYLAERTKEKAPVLLLIKHPELLFDLEQIAPLFAQMEQAHGSLFLAARSTADFGKMAPRLLKNASVLLVHRSQTSFPFEQYHSLPWWKSHPFLDGTLQRLSDRDCFAIAEGVINQVRIDPVPIDHAAVAYATRCLSASPPSVAPRPFELDEEEEREWQTALAEFLGKDGKEVKAPNPTRRRRRGRRKRQQKSAITL